MTKVALALLAAALVPAAPQESNRVLEKPGEHHKHLTMDTVDRWTLDGIEDEVLRVDVRSGDFDPVLELVRLDGSGRIVEVLVPPVDDAGSTSHMLKRLPSAGKLAILVHGPDNRGGGRYRLYVERLRSVPLPDGATSFSGRLDDKGNAHVRLTAEKGRVLVPRGKGVSEVIDPKGYSLGNWSGCYTIDRSGEHYVRVRGEPRAPYEIGFARVERRKLIPGADVQTTVEPYGLHEWTFDTVEGGLHHIELRGEDLEMRVIDHGDPPARALSEAAHLRRLRTHSKGPVQRRTLVARLAVGQRVQVRSRSSRPADYRLRRIDGAMRLDRGDHPGNFLSVGGSEYWAFDAQPGEVLRVRVKSMLFDPVLRLHDGSGQQIGEADDGGGGLEPEHSWLVRERGRVFAEVASFGNGGGGQYDIELTAVNVPRVAMGGREAGELMTGAVAYWHVNVAEEEQVLVLVGSDTFDPRVTVIDPDGAVIGSASRPGPGADVVLAFRPEGSGRHTITVQGGSGPYTLRVIDPDAGSNEKSESR